MIKKTHPLTKQEKQIQRLAQTATHMVMTTYVNKKRLNMWNQYDIVMGECKAYVIEALNNKVSPIRVPKTAHDTYFKD